MIKDFFGDHLTPLSWGERLPSVWDKPFTFSEQEWAGKVTDQQFIQNSAESLSGEYQRIGEIMRDTFVGLHDRMAHFQGRDDDLVSTELFRHLSESDEWQRLKEKTRGDTMGSALATSHISKEFLSNLPAEVRQAIAKHQEAQQKLANAEAMNQAGLPISPEELRALREKLEQSQQQALAAMGSSPAQMKASCIRRPSVRTVRTVSVAR